MLCPVKSSACLQKLLKVETTLPFEDRNLSSSRKVYIAKNCTLNILKFACKNCTILVSPTPKRSELSHCFYFSIVDPDPAKIRADK